MTRMLNSVVNSIILFLNISVLIYLIRGLPLYIYFRDIFWLSIFVIGIIITVWSSYQSMKNLRKSLLE